MVAPTSPPGPPQRESTWTNRWSEPPEALTRQRRFPRRIILGAIIIAAVFAGGVGAGWLLKPTQPAPTPRPSTTAAVPMWTPQQAKERACWAFVSVGTQWANGYHAWLATMRPGWRWTDPDVATATEKFLSIESHVASELELLVPPNTPPDVADPIRRYTSAVLEYSAGHGVADGVQMRAQEDAITTAGSSARQACGLPPA